MERRFGYYIFLGLVVGAILGVGWGTVIGNTAWGIVLGAMGGLFLGWFAAAAALERGKGK